VQRGGKGGQSEEKNQEPALHIPQSAPLQSSTRSAAEGVSQGGREQAGAAQGSTNSPSSGPAPAARSRAIDCSEHQVRLDV